jgi:hypothetical protein
MDENVVELRKKIAKYKALAREASDDETTKRIAALIAELEQQLRDAER